MSGEVVPAGARGEIAPPTLFAPDSPTLSPVARVPGLAHRFAVSVALFVVALVVIAYLPYELLRRLEGTAVSIAVTPFEVLAVGAAMSLLLALRYLAKPTVAYGPMAMLTAAAGIAYLFWLAARATVAVVPGHGVGITVTYGTVLELLAVAPLLSLLAAVVTTIEDLRHPGERLRFDYPA